MLSRVADCLFWMSRYIERAENNARILDVNLQLMLDFETQTEADRAPALGAHHQFARRTRSFPHFLRRPTATRSWSSSPSSRRIPTPSTPAFPAPAKTPAACASKSAPRCGSTSTGFTCSFRSEEARELFRSSSYQFYKRILEGSFQFIGITDATMTHGEGWDFIQLGKFIERADRTSRILDVKYHILLPSGERVGGNVDTVQWMAVLRSCSALEAYTKLYVGQIAPWKVAEFLIFTIRSRAPCATACIRWITRSTGSAASPEDRFSNEAERSPASCAATSITPASARFSRPGCTNTSTACNCAFRRSATPPRKSTARSLTRRRNAVAKSQSQDRGNGGSRSRNRQSQVKVLAASPPVEVTEIVTTLAILWQVLPRGAAPWLSTMDGPIVIAPPGFPICTSARTAATPKPCSYFLRENEFETLYLVGDLIDVWSLRRSRYWPQTHNDVIQKILRKGRKGTRLIYIPGNHDEFLRGFYGEYGSLTIVRPTPSM